MKASFAHVPTAAASRYLQQLCKHWAHKMEVDFTPEHGRIVFPDGAVATLEAGADDLGVRIEVPDSGDLPRMQEVVARHLDRFASREPPLASDCRRV